MLRLCKIKELAYSIAEQPMPHSHLSDSPKKVAALACVCLMAVCASCAPRTVPSAGPRDHASLGIEGVRGGVVATSEPAAAKVGADILRGGGNAIDAAAAVAFALNVVEPQSSGIGGGGFMMIYLAKTGKTVFVDSRETAPARADAGMFLDENNAPIPFAFASTSGLAVGVPGMVRGIALAMANWGSMSFADVLKPATQMAADGIRVSWYLEQSIKDGINNGRLANEIGYPVYDLARSVFVPGGVPLRRDALLIQPDLARTFRLLAKLGPDGFYSGEIARAIIATQQNARTTKDPRRRERLKGRMTLNDLTTYQAIIREPVEDNYRGYRILSAPPPSSGGLTILQILKLIEPFPIGDSTQGFGFGSTRTLHVMLEAMRLAFADRAIWMGDGDFVPIPEKGLLDRNYLSMRTTLIAPEVRQSTMRAGNPLPFESSSNHNSINTTNPVPNSPEGLNTTHFTIVDSQGNIVSYTNTIESLWGTGLMVPGYGFLLNNELTDFNFVQTFNPDPAHLNPGANDVAPRKRPRSSMAPTMVLHHDQPIAAYGSPGGPNIINSVVNVTLNVIDHQFNVQQAIDAPRISQINANGNPAIETGFAKATIKALEDLGHNLIQRQKQRIGSVQAVVIDELTGLQFGGADSRRDGWVISLR